MQPPEEDNASIVSIFCLRILFLPLPFIKGTVPERTCFVYAVFKVRTTTLVVNGDEGIRTLDPLLARQVLSQLSYTPERCSSITMGLSGLEPPTSRLSGVRSNQLSYKPSWSHP